jgi:hypothetical protein
MALNKWVSRCLVPLSRKCKFFQDGDNLGCPKYLLDLLLYEALEDINLIQTPCVSALKIKITMQRNLVKQSTIGLKKKLIHLEKIGYNQVE